MAHSPTAAAASSSSSSSSSAAVGAAGAAGAEGGGSQRRFGRKRSASERGTTAGERGRRSSLWERISGSRRAAPSHAFADAATRAIEEQLADVDEETAIRRLMDLGEDGGGEFDNPLFLDEEGKDKAKKKTRASLPAAAALSTAPPTAAAAAGSQPPRKLLSSTSLKSDPESDGSGRSGRPAQSLPSSPRTVYDGDDVVIPIAAKSSQGVPVLSKTPTTVPVLSKPPVVKQPTTVVLGPTLEWVPRTRDYAKDPAYAQFRQRTLLALSLLPDYPVDLGVTYRAK